MNKFLVLMPITGIMILTLAGCATSRNGSGANNKQVVSETMNTSDTITTSNSTGATNNDASNTGNSQSNDTSEFMLIKSKGYSVNRTTPNATVKTSSGATLSAWIGVSGTDGHNQFVFFFLNGKYMGTDTAKPSVEITSVKAGGNGISVTYPVYKENDSFAKPSGTPVTITYTWNGSTLVPNKPYPKQFQASKISSPSTASTVQVTEKSYSSTAEAVNAVVKAEHGMGKPILSNPPLNLGLGIKASQLGGAGQYIINWNEGSWSIIVFGYSSNPTIQLAKQVVAYLHTHTLPVPQKQGVLYINKASTSNTHADWQSTIAWQEGSKMYELKQTGDPMHALQTVVRNGD